MLTYRSTSIAFLILALVLIPLSFYFLIATYLLLIVLVSYISLLVWGSACISSGFYVKAFCRKKTKNKILSITFDDGPDRQTTPAVLEFLKRHGLSATFFCIGKNIEGNEDIIRRLVDEGHLIGNHSFSHSNFFDFFASAKMIKDLKKTEDMITEQSGEVTRLFRPPFGVTTPSLMKSTEILGYQVIGWSVRTFDSTIKSQSRIMKRIRKRIRPGVIILFHDNHNSLLPLLDDFIRLTKETGYRIVPLDHLLEITPNRKRNS